MVIHTTALRVNYADTDKMGFVHHSNYPRYYENARWDAFRSLGIPYSELEESGILMPVVKLDVNYVKPLYFEEEIIVETTIEELPSVRMTFQYRVFNSQNELVNTGFVETAFTKKGKPCRPPVSVLKCLQPFFY